MKKVKYRNSIRQFYSTSTFVNPFYYGSGTVITYGSDSAKVRN